MSEHLSLMHGNYGCGFQPINISIKIRTLSTLSPKRLLIKSQFLLNSRFNTSSSFCTTLFSPTQIPVIFFMAIQRYIGTKTSGPSHKDKRTKAKSSKNCKTLLRKYTAKRFKTSAAIHTWLQLQVLFLASINKIYFLVWFQF